LAEWLDQGASGPDALMSFAIGRMVMRRNLTRFVRISLKNMGGLFMSRSIIMFAAFAVSLMCAEASQDIYATRVIKDVIDGNTIILDGADNQQNVTCLLWGVDAPEIDQPIGKDAKAFLEDVVKGTEVHVYITGGH